MITQSKQILPASGFLEISFTFKVVEIKSKKPYFTHGKSKVYNNVSKYQRKIINSALYNGYKKVFPSGTYTMINIKIKSYNINYFIEKYKIAKSKKGHYEKWREPQTNKLRISKITKDKTYDTTQYGYPNLKNEDIKG